MLILYNIMLICIYKFILLDFLPFNYIILVFTIVIVFFIYLFFKYFCPLAAVANKCSCLWENKGILILK